MKNETIVDRVVARLKAQPLGDLITEEDLHDIVKQAIPKVFFEKRTRIDGDGYYKKEVEVEPAIYEIMRELLRDEAKKVIEKHIKDNAEHMMALWAKVFDAGLIQYVEDKQEQMVRSAMQGTLIKMANEINNERQRMGLPPLPMGPF